MSYVATVIMIKKTKKSTNVNAVTIKTPNTIYAWFAIKNLGTAVKTT